MGVRLIGSGPAFFVRGKWAETYFYGAREEKILRLLRELHRSIPDRPNTAWLLRYRQAVRDVQHLEIRTFLSFVVERTQDARLRVIAIWLRGRCRGHIGTSAIAAAAATPDRVTRKEAVRALRRLGAVAELRAIAAVETDPRIRRMATLEKPVRTLDERMTGFLQQVTRLEPSRHEMSFQSAVDLAHRESVPLKSLDWIRAVLERIRALVRGGDR